MDPTLFTYKFTLYEQERLPPHASIEWITSIFSEYGTVAYVSLPKFKDATRIKGFAFVEFCDSDSAAKALKVSFLCPSGNNIGHSMKRK